MFRGETAHRVHDRLRGLDLTPLYQDCILKSNERRETYDAIAGELCDYGLQWSGSLVDARAFRCKAPGMSIYSMRYGDEVLIRPNLYKNFVLVHASIRKSIEIESDGRVYQVPEGRVFFSSPKRSIALRWQENCEQVLIRIPHGMLSEDDSLAVPQSGAFLPEALVAPFAHQLSALLAMARQPSDIDGFGLWQEALQASLAGIVAASLGVSGKTVLTAEVPESQTKDRLERLDEFIQTHLDRPIRHNDLEKATRLGRSQVNQLVQMRFGCSPMILVRRRRLEAVRRSLEANPDQDLTQLSLRYGFDHQGRFSQYYKAQFGEAPSETRRRLRGVPPTGRNG
jgi:AraC-like DNA-binding protein